MNRGYLLSLPALVLFGGLLILPLALTLVLSFNVFDYQVGVRPISGPWPTTWHC